jgi:hypothetical protein
MGGDGTLLLRHDKKRFEELKQKRQQGHNRLRSVTEKPLESVPFWSVGGAVQWTTSDRYLPVWRQLAEN